MAAAVLEEVPAGQEAPQLPVGSVLWACIHGEDVRGAFLASVVGMLTGPYADLIGSFYDLASGPVLSIARNTCASALLEGRLEWLWFVDTDTVFSPQVLPALMALADPVERPVVAAAVPITGRNPRNLPGLTGDLYWAAFRHDEVGGLEAIPHGTELAECEQVDAVGTGCVLIHRSVFEAIGPGPFNEMSSGSSVLGEDLAFCRRAAQKGIPVYLASRVRCGHVKAVTL